MKILFRFLFCGLIFFFLSVSLFAGGKQEVTDTGVGVKGGDLVLAVPEALEPASFDGHIDAYQSAWLFNSFIADPLIVLGPDNKYYPALAKEWKVNENSTEYTFFLKEGVTFQDETELNAEAVKYNFDRVKNPDLGSVQLSDDLGPIHSVDVIDKYTVKVTYKEPWVVLLDALRRMPIWSPTAAEKYSFGEFDKHLVGAGPFLFKTWEPNNKAVFERWENYGGWNSMQDHTGPVYLNSITLQFIGEQSVLGNMVKTGAAHIVQELPALYVDTYKNTDKNKLISGFQAGTGLQMVMNITKPPLDQIEVRKALLHAINQEQVNDLVYDGYYLPVYGPINEIHPCYWEGAKEMYAFNPDTARSLLDKAGWVLSGDSGVRVAKNVPGVEDGEELKIGWTVLHHPELGEAVQMQLSDVGVSLEIEVVPGPVQKDRVEKRAFDLIYERQRTSDPRILDQIWNSKYYDMQGGWAWTGLKDPELDAILDKITSLGNNEERCRLAVEAQKIIMEYAPMIPTLTQPVYYALDNNVEGFLMGAEGNWFYPHNIYIK